MKLKFLTAFLIIVPHLAHLQQFPFNSQSNWSLNKKELQLGLGATQFNGDLGGAQGIGKDYSIKDIDLQATRFAGWLGYRQRFHRFFATTSSLCLFQLKGNDKWSQEISRLERNSHFRAFCVEVQQRFEFIFASTETYSPIYNFPGNYSSKKHRNEQYYVFGGVGLLYFNSRAEYIDGSMVALRPLKTEGQSKMYSPITLTIPFGLGFRVGLDRSWRIGMELAYVKTFSDYIDDVSTKFADPSKLSSPEAIYFSNPTTSTNTAYMMGKKRGDSEHQDAYYHVNFILTRNLTFKDYGKQRQKYNLKFSGRFKV